MKQPLLSICIPTEGTLNWVLPTIESFYQDDVDLDLYEVICTDNGKKDDLSEAVKSIKYPNFHYYRTTSKGFLNQIDAFEKSSGLFCKMQNSRNPVFPGVLKDLLALADRYKESRPVIFCLNGALPVKKEFIACPTLDSFVQTLGIFSTWSGGACAWREDIDALRGKKLNDTFPHVRYLFDCGDKQQYIVYNRHLSNELNDTGKGGTNPFRDFLFTYPCILKGLLDAGRISSETFESMKGILFRFSRETYINDVILPTRHTFDTSGLRESMKAWYGDAQYHRFILTAYLLCPLAVWKRTMKRLRAFCVKIARRLLHRR